MKVNSIGKCTICLYEGPGPRHDCDPRERPHRRRTPEAKPTAARPVPDSSSGEGEG